VQDIQPGEEEVDMRSQPFLKPSHGSYLGDRDQEDRGLRPAWANSSQDSISKITRAKWTRGVAQATKHLICKCETLSSNPTSTKKPPKTTTKTLAWLSHRRKGKPLLLSSASSTLYDLPFSDHLALPPAKLAPLRWKLAGCGVARL
jgi:hypothetical protein